MNHMTHHFELIGAMQYGGDHFDDRLAMLHGICSHHGQSHHLEQAESRTLIVLMLEAEHAVAQSHGYTGELADLASHLSDVMQTTRAQLLSLVICDILSSKLQWDQSSVQEVQQTLWRHVIDGVDREEKTHKPRFADLPEA
jgi:predicted GTPase